MVSEVCVCQTDPDGHCAKCRKFVCDAMANWGDKFRKYTKQCQELAAVFSSSVPSKCEDCAKKYADLACSMLFGILAEANMEKAFADAALTSITRLLMGLGVTGFPLTIKAYKELCWKNGWNDAELFQ